MRHMDRAQYPYKCEVVQCEFTAPTKLDRDRHTNRHKKWIAEGETDVKLDQMFNSGGFIIIMAIYWLIFYTPAHSQSETCMS